MTNVASIPVASIATNRLFGLLIQLIGRSDTHASPRERRIHTIEEHLVPVYARPAERARRQVQGSRGSVLSTKAKLARGYWTDGQRASESTFGRSGDSEAGG